jgi:hypothetical protein
MLSSLTQQLKTTYFNKICTALPLITWQHLTHSEYTAEPSVMSKPRSQDVSIDDVITLMALS